MRERGLPAPFVEELASPGGELLKRFFEKIRADGFQVVAEELAEAEVLLVTKILAALRGRRTTSMLFLSILKGACSKTNRRKRWQRFRIVVSSMAQRRVAAKPPQ